MEKTLDYATIRLEVTGGIATLVLNQPDSLNALSIQMMQDLRQAVVRLESESAVRALVVTGAGRAFCAGASQAPGNAAPPDDPDYLVRDLYNPLIAQLVELRVPKLAAVNGVAAGAGMSLALACDIVVAARSAYFLPAFVNQALVPDSGATWHLPRALGAARATAFMMLNARLPAQQAADWGMIWACVDDEALQAEAGKLASQLAQGPTVALAQTPKLVRVAQTHTLAQQLQAELEGQRLARVTSDRREAQRAFAEKRKPEFSGR